MLEPNFEEADGLGIGPFKDFKKFKILKFHHLDIVIMVKA